MWAQQCNMFHFQAMAQEAGGNNRDTVCLSSLYFAGHPWGLSLSLACCLICAFALTGFRVWHKWFWSLERLSSTESWQCAGCHNIFAFSLFYRCYCYYQINSCKHYPWVFALITALVIQCPRSITAAESYYSASPPTFLLGAQWR